ncbi:MULTISPECIES: type I glyceraldehyde-3-phosphate dehydrogenase [Halomonadaceae]|jgi:glyceraldehyde 3-phosphate dehydrogenase|uniref:Glyceraldehyde-3-phosphate dehydrogenase n=1 Tax=Vreelandella halophila TaxID=86177 RepID=A0A9X4YDR5_9GAMM|nr:MULTISPECIES: type I glyceraldehyde-3-phosphate dehydrogenase [Halomonas]MYL27829.1 type I glyceraldehyde-3-phosphate dehydrogenase [Halomonas utahensis]MYL74955.1 type I glyceraldehyde-3-phosphate dehydrogenase [Halomonas sp. 22501_18_FS]
MLRVAISGFGRIGRCLVWAIHEQGLEKSIQVVAINDLVEPHILSHLLRHDTTHGHFRTPVTLEGDRLSVGSQVIRCVAEKDPAKLPWEALGVDLVLECTGKLKTRALLQGHLDAGAGRVLVAYPVPDADRTVVYGINHDELITDDRVVSNASCTTNCLAPVVKVLDDAFGVVQGQMTTIHSYTNDQNLIDKAHRDLYRARAAASNMIPTRTGAADSVGRVLPALAGKLDGMAVRVPTINVSMVDLHAILATGADVDAINAAMKRASEGSLRGVLGYSDEPLVSVDFNHSPFSAIHDAGQTRVLGTQAKVLAWYDNEWGFTNRMLDVACVMAQQ